MLELKATDISYGSVPASVTSPISPPTGAKVVTVSAPAGSAAQRAAPPRHAHRLHKLRRR